MNKLLKKSCLLSCAIFVFLVCSCEKDVESLENISVKETLHRDVELAISIVDQSFSKIDILNDDEISVLKKVDKVLINNNLPILPLSEALRTAHFSSGVLDEIDKYIFEEDLPNFIKRLENMYLSVEQSNYSLKYRDMQIIRNFYIFASLINRRAEQISTVFKIMSEDQSLRVVSPLMTRINLGSLQQGDKVPLPDGLYPHMEDPNKFIEVRQTFVYIKHCAPGTIYSHKSQCCVWADDSNTSNAMWDCIKLKVQAGGLGAIAGAGLGAIGGAGVGSVPAAGVGYIFGFLVGSGLFIDCFS